MTSTTQRPATAKQLSYLRVLAQRTGTTFTPPASSRHASREIERMRGLKAERTDPRERGESLDRYAAAPDDEEPSGRTAVPTGPGRTPHSRQAPGSEKPRSRTARATVIASHTRGGSPRQVITVAIAGRTLVIDRSPARGDARVLARLEPEEPQENARLIARMYIADTTSSPPRRVTAADLKSPERAPVDPAPVRWETPLIAGIGATFQIQRAATGGIAVVRWTKTRGRGESPAAAVPLRQVVAQLEDYQPAIAMTRAAIDANDQDPQVSVVKLKAELQRLTESRIVLNRRLREHVQRAVEHDQTTMSAIAVRCGRFRTSDRGGRTGETSWLARRIGVLAEAGAARPTPWVHTDVLAVIARDGLGINPCEAELG
ncbi:MAG: hypothetical protein JWM60_1693 [Solirubrobacterales bacterium]|nr:hypothetical protein [Solirubrobacterales bacterium]